MKLIKDNRKTDIMYVDKANLQYAENEEILKLVSPNNSINTYINTIAGAYRLNQYQISVIKYLLVNSDVVNTYGEVSAKVARVFAKTPITIARAIENLRKQGLVLVNVNGEIKISSIIENNIEVINKAKFIVIEVTTNNNTKPIL